MRVASPLEGRVVVVQDDPLTARKIELALGQAGAAVFVTLEARQTLDLMWHMKPFSVVMNPKDLACSIFIRANARDNGSRVVQYVEDGKGHGGGIRVSRGAPVKAIVDILLEAATFDVD